MCLKITQWNMPFTLPFFGLDDNPTAVIFLKFNTNDFHDMTKRVNIFVAKLTMAWFSKQLDTWLHECWGYPIM